MKTGNKLKGRDLINIGIYWKSAVHRECSGRSDDQSAKEHEK